MRTDEHGRPLQPGAGSGDGAEERTEGKQGGERLPGEPFQNTPEGTAGLLLLIRSHGKL